MAAMLSSSVMLIWGILSLAACSRAAPLPSADPNDVKSLTGRRLHGRFLHITDIHPDPYYKTYSSTESDSACHRQHGPAGLYGAETSGCDSPVALVNATFKWIEENLRGKIDFVVWTGDSARHDNDDKIPRTTQQVLDQNEFVVGKLEEVFGANRRKKDAGDHGVEASQKHFSIPIIPTLGNNDVMPHNIFLSGPNKWTKRYLDIWRSLIPEEQRHAFQQGGWFSVEVVPNKLAVISLNTLYFFDSNSGVNGCANKHEPGYEHMDWLRIQLRIIRERGMKAILIGHVPPARTKGKLSWDETCWQKYTLWQRQYRDVIVGNLFGHMNLDHFILQDFGDIKKGTKRGKMGSLTVEEYSPDQEEDQLEDGEITVASASDYLVDLRQYWAKLPSPPNVRSKESASLSTTNYWDTESDKSPSSSIWQWTLRNTYKLKESTRGRKHDKDGEKKKFIDAIGGPYAERFSLAHVAPSIVPTYFPTLRVFSYNISGLEDLIIPFDSSHTYSLNKDYDHDTNNDCHPPKSRPRFQTPISADQEQYLPSDQSELENEIEDLDAATQNKKKKKGEKGEKRKPKKKKYKFKVPTPPSKSAPPGPAHSPQPLTLTGYVQYYANLTWINNDFTSESLDTKGSEDGISLDTSTYGDVGVDDNTERSDKWREGKHAKHHQGEKPRPKPHPHSFEYQVEYDTTTDKVFGLKDLTVRSYVELAGRIAGNAKAKGFDVVEDNYEEEGEMYDSGGDSDENVDDLNTKKNHKSSKSKRPKKPDHNAAWYTFVARAFVGTMDPEEIEENFGVAEPKERHQKGVVETEEL